MAGSTDHYGLTTLGSGESFATDGYKYVNRDRHTIDQKLYLGAEGHRHTGDAGVGESPTGAPNLTLSTTGGTIPAGTRVSYKISFVNSLGEESAASAESFVDTAAAVTTPAAPALSTASTGGVLNPGNYYYVLSAYTLASTVESLAENSAYITVPAVTGTNVITLTLPSLPTGASGFNVYRRAPGQTRFFHLATVAMNVATPPDVYEDDGSVTEDCDRTLPTANTTNGTNSVEVSIPGATPTVPTGYTWKVYRTYVSPTYGSRSLLQHVVETVSEVSSVVITSITDVGQGLSNGFPISNSQFTGSPSKIDLTDAAEVQGSLPPGLLDHVIHHSFEFPGVVEALVGDMQWAFPFPDTSLGRIIGAVCNLGVGSSPASTDVIVDINVNGSSIYTAGNRPRVPVGDNVGSFASTVASPFLSFGDVITCDIDQAGGGASPTDENLVVTLVIHVSTGSTTTSTVYA